VTLLLLASVALGAGLGVVFIAEARPVIAVLLGLVASLVVLAIALAMPPEESVAVGGVSLVGTALVRAMVVAWAASLAVLTLLEALVGGRPTVVGPSLIGLAVAAVALASDDPAMSVAALAAGGVVGILVPGLEGWLDAPSAASRLPTTARGALAILGSGLLAIAVIAWGASAAGPLGGAGIVGDDNTVRLALGLALMAMVVAVALRTGLIPFHVWAARFMEGVSPLAIPAAFTWGSAAFVLVAVAWSQVALQPIAAGDVERLLIVALGLISVVLGGLAAMFHDDIEHVLGYSILADAGVAILAFASLEPEAAAAARNWLVASASVKTALAAWAAIVRATYGGHRLAELAGWARRSPALGAAFAVILIAAIGLPGMALAEARSTLINGAVGDLGGLLSLAVAAMPAVYLGRIAAAGIAPISVAVSGAPSGRPRWSGARAAGWSGGTVAQTVRALPVELRANRAPLMALGVLALGVMALLTAMGGAGG
jgi:NADH:ubiquinone oxidoreductase subunit 5 (subunit L)/multisubunit Na+/H+ antiporter MnhA subunit